MKKEVKPSVAIVVFSAIQSDARVLRQIEYLSPYYAITVISYGQLNESGSSLARLQVIPNPRPGRWRQLRTLALLPLGRLLPQWAYERWYWGRVNHQEARRLLEETPAQIIHANDWNTLPLAVSVAKKTGAKIVLDLHEYAPLEGEDRWHWRTFVSPMIDYFLRQYGGNAAAYVTVNETIAQKYQAEYGFLPAVVMNIPHVDTSLPFQPTQATIQLIHHGIAKRDRHLELMIEAVALAQSRFHLHFMLMETDLAYIAELKLLASQRAPDRIHFHPPVPPKEIVFRLSTYDMGFYLLPFTNYNNSVALPNKFFDFISAGLALCIGPSPEMARLTKQYGFGIVADSFHPQDVANLLNQLSEADIDQMKHRAHQAQQSLNAATEMRTLITLYQQLLEPATS
ncbi:MAG: glycosyltransferase [Chloroflexi bacterium]|nr:glycosyltransferase [Chloroflexota bacterium]MBP8055793.1 glycosyltransferase [Chloroflexota bacterium]